jgi:hypothetical protein
VAGKADDVAEGGAKAAKSGNPPCNSFVPGTEVVLADGSTRPIEDVRTGDLVLATDPETGRTTAKPVTHLISGSGEKDLVDLTVDTDGDRGGRTATLTATDEHPFWAEGPGRWVDAEDLKPGTWLRTDAGERVRVMDVEPRTAQRQQVHNLTVGELHTFYVLAGDTQVLVHNSGPCTAKAGRPQEDAIAQKTGVKRNPGSGQQTIAGPKTGKDRIPDFDVDDSVAKRGTMMESKDVADLEYRGQIRDFEAHANDVLGVPLEIVVRPGTGTRVPQTGGLADAIKSGRIIVTPLDKL